MRVVLLLGTAKGVFLVESDERREEWEIRGPLNSGTWSMVYVGFDARRGDKDFPVILAGGASNWYGPAIWRSGDLGATWTHSSEGLTFGNGGPEIKQVWCVVPALDSAGQRVLYAGVEPAGLFRSDDDGATWRHVDGLRAHPSRENWKGAAGELCLHSIIPHPTDPLQMRVGVSSGDVYQTLDGGRSWNLCNAILDQNSGAHRESLARGLPNPASLSVLRGALAIDELDPAGIYAGTTTGRVYWSADHGEKWKEMPFRLPTIYSVAVMLVS